MKIIFAAVGRMAHKAMAAAVDEYVTRASKMGPVQMRIIPDVKKSAGPDKQCELEGDAILGMLQPGDMLILLDERGREFTSEKFAAWLEQLTLSQRQNIYFVIGGPYGFSDAVYKRADAQMALSQLTLTHEMARLFFAEQLYRAYTIMRNMPYHHR